MTWPEIYNIYGLKSDVTDLRKEEEWKKYKGQIVQWTGQVENINNGMFGGLDLDIKMNSDTFTFDLEISLKENQKPKAMKLRKGEMITFKAVLNSWGTLLPIGLTDGEIIDKNQSD